MLMDHKSICELLPHAGAMCLLDSVINLDDSNITCSAISHTDRDNPLRENNQLSAINAVEYGAQAMAVHSRILAREQGVEPEHGHGYVVALNSIKLHVQRLDTLAMPLLIKAQRLLGENNNFIYQFSITGDNIPAVEGRITVITEKDAKE